MTPQQQDEQNQIRLYEIMRGELDTPLVAEASLDNHTPDSYRDGCSGEGSNIPLNPSIPLNTLSSIYIGGEEASWFKPLLIQLANPIKIDLNSQEVKKQNGNT